MTRMNLRKIVRQARRDLWWMQPDVWTAFRLGYSEALRDVERTGLRPFREDAIREAADEAMKRLKEP